MRAVLAALSGWPVGAAIPPYSPSPNEGVTASKVTPLNGGSSLGERGGPGGHRRPRRRAHCRHRRVLSRVDLPPLLHDHWHTANALPLRCDEKGSGLVWHLPLSLCTRARRECGQDCRTCKARPSAAKRTEGLGRQADEQRCSALRCWRGTLLATVAVPGGEAQRHHLVPKRQGASGTARAEQGGLESL